MVPQVQGNQFQAMNLLRYVLFRTEQKRWNNRKTLKRSTAVLVVIYPVHLTQAEAYSFSVNHASKNFISYNLRVKGGKFGTDGTNVRRMNSLLQQKWRRKKKCYTKKYWKYSSRAWMVIILLSERFWEKKQQQQ